MSTRTRRKELETKTKAQRRKERWQAKLAAATTPAARYAVKSDWFRASVELMIHRHDSSPARKPRATTCSTRPGTTCTSSTALDGGDYDQPGQ